MRSSPRLYRLQNGEGRISMFTAGGWLEKRKRIRADLAREFSARAAIGPADFLRSFYDAPALPSMHEFRSRYIPDAGTLDEIFTAVGSCTGLAAGAVKARFSGTDTFPQFGERLLRSGAYAGGAP